MSRQSDDALAALRGAVKIATEAAEPGTVKPCGAEDFETLDRAGLRRDVETILLAPRPDLGLQRLHDVGLLAALMPEVEALVGFGEGGQRHKDVWDHTKRVVAQTPRRAHMRWAALFHDIGKVRTRRTDPDGQVQFHGHAEVGARMAAKRLKKLGFPKEQARTIRLLILFHQRPSQYDPTWTDAAVRRFGRETEEVLDELLDFSRADMTTKYEGKRRRGHQLIEELSHRLTEIRELDARVPPLPKGLGLGIIERFNLQPGPRIGQLRNAVEAAVEAGELEPQQEAEVYLSWLEAHIDEL